MQHLILSTSSLSRLVAYVRTDRGTVKRRAANKAYEDEIDQIYTEVACFGHTSDAVLLSPKYQDASRIGSCNLLIELEGLQNISFEQDFFSIGMDSLQVLNLVRHLRSSFGEHHGEAFAHLV